MSVGSTAELSGIAEEPEYNKRGSLQRARWIDRLTTIIMWVAALFLVLVIIWILLVIFMQGISIISWEFLTYPGSVTEGINAVGPQIWVTFYTLILTLLIATPIGVAAAIYMAEYARPNPFTNTVRFSVEALSSTPSIVFGIFGALAFLRYLGLGFSVLSGALTIAILNLPLVVRLAEDALRAVPNAYREGSDALGGTTWETIRKVVLPSAIPGIATAVVLTAGRTVGETAPFILTMGTTISPNAYYSLNPLETGETLAVHIWKLAVVGVPGMQNTTEEAWGSALVIMVAILILNSISAFMISRYRRQLSGK